MSEALPKLRNTYLFVASVVIHFILLIASISFMIALHQEGNQPAVIGFLLLAIVCFWRLCTEYYYLKWLEGGT